MEVVASVAAPVASIGAVVYGVSELVFVDGVDGLKVVGLVVILVDERVERDVWKKLSSVLTSLDRCVDEGVEDDVGGSTAAEVILMVESGRGGVKDV